MTSPESRIKEIRERWDKNGEDDCYSINELFEAIGLAFAQLDLANKRTEILRAALKFIADDLDMIGVTPTECSHLAKAKNALKAADEVK